MTHIMPDEIREARKTLGWDQETLADKLDLSSRTIQRYEAKNATHKMSRINGNWLLGMARRKREEQDNGTTE